jgi:hypothetical protein
MEWNGLRTTVSARTPVAFAIAAAIGAVIILVMLMTAERIVRSTRDGGPQDGMILADVRGADAMDLIFPTGNHDA